MFFLVQKSNNVADIFVNNSGGVKVVARNGYYLPFLDDECNNVKAFNISRIENLGTKINAVGFANGKEMVVSLKNPTYNTLCDSSTMTAAVQIANATLAKVNNGEFKSSITHDDLKDALACLLDKSV